MSPEQVTLIHSLCVEWVPVESGAPGTAGVLPFGASEAAILDKVRQALGRSDLSDRAALQTYRDAMRALEIFVGRAELAPGRYRYANPLSEEELAQQPFIAHKLVERDGNTIAVEVRAEHLKLLRHANLELLEGGEGQLLFEIDPKRPYGDMTNFYLDMGDLLGIHPAGRPHLGQRADEFTDEQIRQLDQLHETMEPVLQVFLREAKFEPGTFVRDGSGPWKRR